MTQKQIKNRYYIYLSILFFFADIALFGFMQQHIFLMLHCFIMIIASNYYTPSMIVPPIFLLCCSSYLEETRCGMCLLYILPALYLGRFLQERLHIKTVIPYVVLIFSLSLKGMLLFFIHGSCISLAAWATQIIHNLILTIFLHNI